ncbi:hypothetical protein [Nonomuraea sp. NPDC049400]|uniref:hypothetical protein n=1 Tax=Nonomuraea sp. NPDC049400 TaxID=3364352 RepID=UPI0037B793C5
MRRILAEDTLKPWQHQSWIFICDPAFAAKATRVLDLYARRWDDIPLGDDEYVISADEKDLHPGPLPLPPRPATGQIANDAHQPRLRPRRRPGAPGRL